MIPEIPREKKIGNLLALFVFTNKVGHTTTPRVFHRPQYPSTLCFPQTPVPQHPVFSTEPSTPAPRVFHRAQEPGPTLPTDLGIYLGHVTTTYVSLPPLNTVGLQVHVYAYIVWTGKKTWLPELLPYLASACRIKPRGVYFLVIG